MQSEELLALFGDEARLKLSPQDDILLVESAQKGLITFTVMMKFLKAKHSDPAVVAKATEILDQF